MKKFLFFILLFSSVTLLSQQDRFLIGVDWINPTSPAPATNYQLLSNAYWDTLKSFGVNFGALNIGRNQSNGLTKINTELTQAASRDIRIFLWTYQLNPARGRRWMYQVENNWDFTTHISGISPQPDANAEPHWSQVKVNDDAPNYWRLVTGNQTGYVAEGLINDSEIPDGTNYYTKVRIRKTSPDITHTAIIKVIMFNKNNGNVIGERILYADDSELSLNVWCEKQLFNFYKAATLPYNYIEGANNRILNDPVGLTGVEDYVSTTQTYTPYEIKIEWFGNVSCDIDYVVIDDVASHNLHNGVYDNILNQIVTEFGNHQGLGKIKVMDEPGKDELLPIRRMKSKLDEYLAINGNQSKSALCFHVPPYNGNTNWPIAQRFHSQSKLDIAISDIYPISLSIPTPSEPNYYESLQNILNTALTYWLNDEINKTNLFNNTFWFTPQTHSWLGGQREPSVYEIKAMTNLGICYGAKGIHYFMFSKPPEGNTLLDDNNINNPIPRYKDAYQFDKWNLLKQQNQKLAAIGNELLSLTWQNAFYINNGNQPTGTYISGVQSIGDNLVSTYVQLGIFKKTVDPNNNNLEYFFIVNRRTLSSDQRNIAVTINKSNTIYNNWKVTEVGTSNTWTVSNTGSFTANYQPGEGKLFKMEPVMLAGGTLAYNENIPQTTTINSGVTLTILPGVNLSFTNGASLTVNGTLIANGTTTNKITFDFIASNSTTQNGIKINTGASLYVSNVVIKYAWYGIYCSNTSSSPINNWEITNCNTGIYFSSTNVGISNNYIHNNSMGIALYNSSPTLTLNKITANTNYGVSSSGSTSIPLFGSGSTQGKNKISDNPVGVCAFSNSLPMLGNNSPLSGGYNTLGENASYNIYAITSGIIYAINNYWGTIPPNPPTASKIWISNGVILYSPYLSSDPTGLNKSAPLAEDAALALLTKAMNLIEQKDFASAREICLEIINNYSDSYAAFNALGLLTQTYDLKEKETTKLNYKTLFNKDKKKLNAVAGLILAELDKENKLKNVDEVISKFKDDTILEDALFAKFIYYLNDVQDNENARLISNELDKLFPNSLTAFDAHSQLGDKDYLGKVYPFAKAGQEQKESIISSPLPTEYDLFANYPNPFNPVTIIKYALPYASNVNVTVYNTLGQIVKVYFEGTKEAGYYSVNFNGENLSSGVYLYSINAISANGRQNFNATKKMILIK